MPPRVPAATYRLQLNRAFPLEAATRLVPYLEALGVTDLYLSPLFQARAGSTHGYDATDYGRLNPALGTSEDLARLAAAARERGMGILLDMVPNHMGIDDPSNAWWWDVLERGQASPHARFFDIDWDPPDPALRGKVLLPVLGAPCAEVLDRGELRLATEAGRPVLRYFERRFPLSPESARAVRRNIGERLPDRDELDEVLSAQHYLLAFWREGLRRINYRRFFDISHLAGLRVEDQTVFDAVHALLFRWLRDGWITGIRIDHPDGLADPTGYFARLQAGCARALGEQERAAGAGAPARPCYVVAEKILTGDEALRGDWAVHGTTGYEFLNDLNGLFVDDAGAAEIRRVYGRVTGSKAPVAEVIHACKREVLESRFPAELEGLLRRLEGLAAIAGGDGAPAPGDLREALVAVIACFPVYRTYAREGAPELAGVERERAREALASARRRAPQAADAAYDLIARVLEPPEGGRLAPGGPGAADRMEFVVRFQQLTAPIMAKGVEDTAFYRDVALLSLNEVGGEPARGGLAPAALHARNAGRRARWPGGLLATATHDTKRGEDARARLNVLTEVAGEWEAALSRWRDWNAPLRRDVDGKEAPDANEEYLLYQAAVGAWPLSPMDAGDRKRFAARIREYMRKALREAKVHTRWIDAREDYEAAVDAFAAQALGPAGASPFLEDLARFCDRVAWPGALNALSQVLLKIASPGVPDFYQGTELWDFRLVDPDNRRPVDYEARAAALEETGGGTDPAARARDLLASWRDGRIKMHVMRAALAHRRENPALYTAGDYLPLEPEGARAAHAFAFARRTEEAWCVAAAGRLFARLEGEGGGVTGAVWEDGRIALPDGAPGRWTNLLTGAVLEAAGAPRTGAKPRLPLRDLFRDLPVALLAPAPV